ALSVRLDQKETGDVLALGTAGLVERLGVEKEWKVPPRVVAALTALARRLGEGALVGLLRAPLCCGQTRPPGLDELGRRTGQRFADGWEFVEWARTNRPTLDLRATL